MKWRCTLAALAAAIAMAAVAMAEEPAPPAPTNAGTGRPQALKADCPPPEYPPASTRAEETGTTRLRLSVNSSGELTQSSVARSSGHERLDAAALHGLTRCKFTPARDKAGVAVAAVMSLDYVWRLDGPPRPPPPDPWFALRSAKGATRDATGDLAAVPFSSMTQATVEQRIKILAALQRESVLHAGCGRIESVSVSPARTTDPPPLDPKTGKPIRFFQEFWTATQCGLEMPYLMRMRISEIDGASFTMLPLALSPGDEIRSPPPAPILVR